jgi:HSP20 family protein
MSIIRFDPFTGFMPAFENVWEPAVDIYENDRKELVLKAELPDVKREDITVLVENQMLTLKGQRKLDADVKKEQYHRVERAYGAFTRAFRLPPTVDASKIAAKYENGVLTVTLPFREDARPRTINVEVAA